MAEDTLARPLCRCHGEPMQRNGVRPWGYQEWRCAVRNSRRMQDVYDALSGVEYNSLLLRRRRTKALRRMAHRHRRAES